MSEPKIKKIKLSELIPDPQNANKGTERGRYMLEHSISTLGAGRSVLVDKNNLLIAGNKTTSVAYESGFENAILVETDGTELVVVRRTDLDLTTDSRAKQLAIADNRTGQINLNFDAEVLLKLDKEIDLSGFFTNDELNQLSLSLDDDEGGNGSSGDNDTIPEVVESRVKLGDVWQLGRHFICCADCTVEENVRKLLSFVEGRSPDMVWADPPYGVKEATNRKEKRRGKLAQCNDFDFILGDKSSETAKKSFIFYNKVFPKAMHFWWGANYYCDILPVVPSWIVWDKREDIGSDDNADCELAWSKFGMG
jgi:hypothetical protein